jgi:V/A-type H+-transporting ATPase subunit D
MKIIHQTRTNLLKTKEISASVEASLSMLKSKRLALVKELLSTIKPFLRSREDIRDSYSKAIDELLLSFEQEGRQFIKSIEILAKRALSVEIVDKNIWGLKYRDITTIEKIIRSPDERGYGYLFTTSHLEECIYLFEKILDSMLKIATFESKIKRISDEIIKTTRKIKILEEKILPDLKYQIKAISQFLEERERENYFRLKLKKFKKIS